MVWDTGSSETVVQGHTCSSCHLKYDYQDEEGSSFKVVNPNERTIEYGSAVTKGFDAQDTICLSPKTETCLESANLFVVTEQSGLPKTYHGIQGLSVSSRSDEVNLVQALRA